ncbi:hypothetical protein AB0F17_02555 [Nonomuraea sp. NPDC026600]|uniref:hypothetical protein n=1 Tax=Nonomuraea sp. NPDC026600 TaxID=3155363 RepID=UPI0033E31C0E
MDNQLDHMPVLSRGRHRNPKRGACFMELASYLAGERWSDHPACTHPLLAALARLVNDNTSDANRGRLVRLVPSIIDLASDDLRVDARIALRCATTALPVSAAERQLALAVSVLAAEEMLARLDGGPSDQQSSGRFGSIPFGSGPFSSVPLSEESQLAMAQVPHAAEQARRFSRAARITEKGFRRYAAPNAVQLSVVGIVQACISDPDTLLRNLLTGVIADCTALIRGTAAETPRLATPTRV